MYDYLIVYHGRMYSVLGNAIRDYPGESERGSLNHRDSVLRCSGSLL